MRTNKIKYWLLKEQNQTKMVIVLRLRNPDRDQFIH